jgi:hypothetical protein
MASPNINVNGSGTFSTLNSAIADSGTGNGDTINITGSWTGDDTTPVTWNHNLTVTTDSESKVQQPHSGRTGGSYRLRPTSGHAFTVTNDVTMTGVDIQNAATGVSDEVFRCGTGVENVSLTRCILGFASEVDQQDILYQDKDSFTYTISLESCIFYEVGRSIVDLYASTSCTITVNINSCSGYNIGGQGGRSGGTWVGCDNCNNSTITVNMFNNLVGYEMHNAVAEDTTFSSSTLNSDYNILALSDFQDYFDTHNNVGDGLLYTFTDDADPGTGDKVGLSDVTTQPYDFELTDHANNDAKGFHTTGTGSNSGLSIPLDVLGNTNSSPYDVGAFAIQAAGGTTVQIAQAAIGMAAQALGVNAKQNLAVSQASVGYAGVGVNANAKTQTEIASAAIGYTGQALNTNAKTMLAIAQSAISYAGQLVSTGSETIVSIANAAIGYAGQAVTVNAKTIIAIAAAGINKAGQSVVTNMINVVGIVNAAITLAGQTFKINKVVHIGAATINAIGRGVTASVGGVVTEIKRRSKWLAGFVVRRKR